MLTRGEALAAHLPPVLILVLFCAINCLNYVDRGIIPGAFDNLGRWMRVQLATDNADAYLGYLQSSFIVGYSVASLSMGHLIHVAPPFRLMAAGLALWALAGLACAAAPNFWALLAARMLSGVGEASFQCSAWL